MIERTGIEPTEPGTTGSVGWSIGLSRRVWVLWVFFSISGVTGCSQEGREARGRLVVGAASSLRELCEQTRAAFEEEHPDVDLSFSFGASSKLARQMQASGAYDVLLSADSTTLDQIASSLAPDSITSFLSNRMVLISRGGLDDPASNLSDLVSKPGRIAVAGPSVPAGRYARELLGRFGVADPLEGRLVSADNVRIALAMVASGAADHGLVYQSDVQPGSGLTVRWVAPIGRSPKIEYVAALRPQAPDAAAAYLGFVRSSTVQGAARTLGFLSGEDASSRSEETGQAFDLISILGVTLKVGLAAILLILIPGVALGFLLARYRFPGRSVVRVFVTLPMVLPPVAVGLVLMMLFARGSALGRAAESVLGGPILLSWPAAAIAAAIMSFPLLVLGSQNAFLSVPRRVEQVAATLGASRWTVFFKVTMPLALRGILHGVVFAFARALGEFGATALVAGRIPGETETISLAIYDRIERFQDQDALLLSAISVVVALLFTGTAEVALRQRETDR